MDETLVTVVVVPRERFSHTRPSLESIYAHTSSLVPLVYVDGGSPGHIKRYLESKARERGFTIIRTEHYLSPNEARNLGMSEVRSKYVVFVDNDVEVEPGWLDSLVQCAEETGAWLVGPLYLSEEPWGRVIHMAGGETRIQMKSGNRFFFAEGRFCNTPLEKVHGQLRREPCDYLEFHCMLVRTEVFEQLGPLDEALLSLREHIDICLVVGQAGGAVYFEPDSVVTYVKPPPVKWSDLPYYLLRWSDKWNRSTLLYFYEKWNFFNEDPSFNARNTWVNNHRRIYLNRICTLLKNLFGWRVSNWMVVHIDQTMSLVLNYLTERKQKTRHRAQLIRPVGEDSVDA